jgi:hypothetical protein
MDSFYEDNLITIYLTDDQLDEYQNEYNLEGNNLKEFLSKQGINIVLTPGNLLVFRNPRDSDNDNPILLGYVDKDNIQIVHLKCGPAIEQDIPKTLLKRYSTQEIIRIYRITFKLMTKEEAESKFGEYPYSDNSE